MKKNQTVVPWTDLLHYAESIKIDWNEAHDILVKDEVPPMYENNTREYEISEMGKGKYGKDTFGWSEKSLKIVYGFMSKNKLKSMIVTGD